MCSYFFFFSFFFFFIFPSSVMISCIAWRERVWRVLLRGLECCFVCPVSDVYSCNFLKIYPFDVHVDTLRFCYRIHLYGYLAISDAGRPSKQYT